MWDKLQILGTILAVKIQESTYKKCTNALTLVLWCKYIEDKKVFGAPDKLFPTHMHGASELDSAWIMY